MKLWMPTLKKYYEMIKLKNKKKKHKKKLWLQFFFGCTVDETIKGKVFLKSLMLIVN
jgi:hypothetical protein